MVFRVRLAMEVEQPSTDLMSQIKVDAQFTYERGKWRGQSVRPPISTLLCDSLEEAMVAVARDAHREFAAAGPRGA